MFYHNFKKISECTKLKDTDSYNATMKWNWALDLLTMDELSDDCTEWRP